MPSQTLFRAAARTLTAVVLGALLAGVSAPFAVAPARAETSVSVDFFYDSLEPHGRWVDHWKYGRVWYPRDVDDDWRPYSRGRWVLTEDYGWYWESSEPFGWAAYHYGRWDRDEDYGWIWIPGDTWGPAWVDWRESDGYVGWAPLPPGVVWRERGFDYGGIDIVSVRYRPAWCFVPTARFVSGDVHRYVLPPARNVTIINNTRNVTNYTVVNNTFINNSVNVTRIRNVTRTNIAPVKVVQAGQPATGTGGRQILPGVNRQQGQLAVFRPEVKAGTRPTAPASTNATPPPDARSGGPAVKGGAAQFSKGQPVPSGATVPPADGQPPTQRSAQPVPVLPQGGFVKKPEQPAAVAAPKDKPAAAVAPPRPDNRAATAEQARLRELEARQAREAARQRREQTFERYTTVTKPRDEVAKKQAAERQELQRIQQNQRTVVQNRAQIPQPPRAAPPPVQRTAAPPPKQPPPPQKQPPPQQKQGQLPPGQPPPR